MYRVKTYNQIAARGLELFPADAFRVGADVVAPDAILLRSHVLTRADLEPALRAVAPRRRRRQQRSGRCLHSDGGRGVQHPPARMQTRSRRLTLAALLLGSRDVIGGMDYVKTLSNVADNETLHDHGGG